MANQVLEDDKIKQEIIALKKNNHWVNQIWNKIAGFLTLLISLLTVGVLWYQGAFEFQAIKFEAKEAKLVLDVARLEEAKKNLLGDSSLLVKTINGLRDSVTNSKKEIKATEGKLSSVKSDLNTAKANLTETLRKKRFNDYLYTSLWKSSSAQLVDATKKLDTQWRETNQEFFKYKQVRQLVED